MQWVDGGVGVEVKKYNLKIKMAMLSFGCASTNFLLLFPHKSHQSKVLHTRGMNSLLLNHTCKKTLQSYKVTNTNCMFIPPSHLSDNTYPQIPLFGNLF